MAVGLNFCWPELLRASCSNVTSVLMDDQTLEAYRDLWVPETKPAAGTYSTLTAGGNCVMLRGAR